MAEELQKLWDQYNEGSIKGITVKLLSRVLTDLLQSSKSSLQKKPLIYLTIVHEPMLSSNIHLYFICHYILLPVIAIDEETKKDHWQGNLIKTFRACDLKFPHM